MPVTAEEWLPVLLNKIQERNHKIRVYDDYYSGRHPMAFTTADFREAFGRMLDDYADNWCKLVVDAAVERMTPVGFRFGASDSEEAADADAWRIWQANKLDARIQTGFVESLVNGVSYLMVWYPPGTVLDEDRAVLPSGRSPRITVEHPAQVIVEHAAGDRDTRLAGLKVFTDDEGHRRATVYLPTWIARFREGENDWSQRSWELLEEFPNPLGVVPIIPMENRPRLLSGPESELIEVIPNQDAVNKLVKDMLVASEYVAMPQRYATGVEAEVDPETGQPVREWRPDVTRFMTVDSPEANIGSLPAGDLRNFVIALDNRVNSIASQTRTPPHYLNASADRLSGESIKAAETGLVARVREKHLHAGEALEEAMRLAFRALGDSRAEADDAEVKWRDPESRTEGELTDSVVKLYGAGLIPWEFAVEKAGYSPTDIDRMRTMRRTESFDRMSVDLSGLSESA